MKGSATQRQKIFDLLKSQAGTWVPCFEVASLALQYSARLKEIRDSGTVILNKTAWVNGVRHSWFMMEEPRPIPKATEWTSTGSLFSDLPERHKDEN